METILADHLFALGGDMRSQIGQPIQGIEGLLFSLGENHVEQLMPEYIFQTFFNSKSAAAQNKPPAYVRQGRRNRYSLKNPHGLSAIK